MENPLEEVNIFKYIRSFFICIEEFKTRLEMVLSASGRLNSILKMKRQFSSQLYRSLMIFIALYGCKCWTLTKETAAKPGIVIHMPKEHSEQRMW